MAVTQPISGAKVGESTTAVGTPSVVNQRQGVFPSSTPPSWVVSSALQVRDAASLAQIKFNLVALPQHGANFDFGGTQQVATHSRSDSSEWGKASVANAAQDIRPTWSYTGKVAWPVVAYAARYAKHVLALDEATPHGFHFVFTGSQLLYPHGKQNPQQWGVATLKSPLPIWGSGFETTAAARRFGGVFLSHRAVVDEFNLDLAAARVPGTNFPFGSPQLVYGRTRVTNDQWGATRVGNAAQDIRPAGIYSNPFNNPVVSRYKGGWVSFAFDQGYQHPHTANLGFYFAGGKQVNATGADSSVFGVQRVYLHMQPVRPTGRASTAAFGTAFLDHFAAKLYPTGWLSDGFGTPKFPMVLKPHAWDSSIVQNFITVKNFFQYIRTSPFTGQPITPPSPKVYNLLQFLRPGGVGSPFVAGTLRISNYLRYLTATGLAVAHTFGTTKVALGRRYIGPAYLSGTQTSFGTPFTAWRNRTISPAGLAAGAFGTLLIKEKAQRCYPVGRASLLAFGVPQVKDRAQRCYPFALDSNLYGTGFVYLWKQEITPAGILQWEFEKDRFGYYTDVFTKNKKITTNGYVSSRFSIAALIYNGARRVSVWGTIPMTRYGTAFVAPRIRSFGVEWYTQEVFGTPYVRTRQVLNLDRWGWHSMKFGIPSRVWSNMQFIKPFSTYDQTTYGRQWVSFGLRDLRPSSILTQPAGSPFVSFNPRYIKPAGIQYGYMGTLHLETHQNIIKLWGYLNEGYGVPTLRNVTPEIKVYGAFTFLPGTAPKVQLMRRYIRNPATKDTGVVGEPFVSYRTRKIRPPAPDYLRWGNALVQFDQSQLVPPQQTIATDSIQAGAGIVPYEEWEFPDAPWTGNTIHMPSPTVRLNTIFAPSLGLIEKFGTLTTRSMVIFVDPGPASYAFGSTKLYGGTKWIDVGEGPKDTVFGSTKVVGPQKIRCGERYESGMWIPHSFHTSQYSTDKWYEWQPQTAGPVFGATTTVTNQYRKIYVSSDWIETEGKGFALYGRPTVTTRPQYIRPAGVNSYKRGLPDVSHEGMKPVYAFPWADDLFGATAVQVQDYGPKWVRPGGLAAGGMGVGRIELKHRRVYPTGIYQFTSPKGAQYIGPYLRIYLKPGLDHAEFGTLYIDYKHRKVYQADVTDDMEPWATSTATKVKHQARGYFIEGTNFGVQFGLADVGNRVKHVRPAGWEEFETGFSYVPTSYPGLSKLKAQAFIMRPYTSTMEFGNGTVAHG